MSVNCVLYNNFSSLAFQRLCSVLNQQQFLDAGLGAMYGSFTLYMLVALAYYRTLMHLRLL